MKDTVYISTCILWE